MNIIYKASTPEKQIPMIYTVMATQYKMKRAFIEDYTTQ